MRAFIGCDIFHPNIKGILSEIKKTGADIKFVEAQNMHATLKFLGEISDSQISVIEKAMKKSSSGNFPLEVKLKGVGVFPSLSYIKVIWIGLICPWLIDIQKNLDESLGNIGFRNEKKFHLHLTIGRVRSARNKEILRETISGLEKHELGIAQIKSMNLKMSKLTPSGPIYTDLKVVK